MKMAGCRLVCWVALFCGLSVASKMAAAETVPGPSLSRAAASEPSPSNFRSSEDGWFDISGFIDQTFGFVPLVIPITEPAVGLGGVAALAFIDKPKNDAAAGFGRPNLTVVGGLATENGTKGAMAGDIRHWLDDRVKTMVGVINVSVNLDYYGIGRESALERKPQTYNLETLAGVAGVQYRLGDTRAWVGVSYALADTTVAFDVLPMASSLPNFQRDSRVGGITPSFSYDSRDNIFTPTSGEYLDISAGLFSKALGSDTDFQRVSLTAIQYLPMNSKLTLGILGSAMFSFGEVPFYLRPFVYFRGVPAMQYQGESTAQLEAEVRWQFWQRFSLVGFAGAGAAWNNFERLDNKKDVTAAGIGVRYELARKYGMHMGIDVAYGPDGPAYYIQFGSAWMRP